MVGRVLSLAVFVLISYMVNGLDIPRGYILDVKQQCGTSARSQPVVNILSDLNIRAIAKCAMGDQNFTRIDAANYKLIGSYSVLKKGCTFTNVRGVYKLDIAIMYGSSDAGLISNEEIYTVSCTFNSKNKVKAPTNKITEGLIRPEEMLIKVGTREKKSSISLYLQDVKNRNVIGAVPIDKTLSLFAQTEGKLILNQLRPVSCFAIGGKTKKRYAILRAGCGDGQIIPSNKGFMTIGRKTRSPYFKTFFVEGDQLLSFECTFVLCQGCDGSSCTPGNNIRG